MAGLINWCSQTVSVVKLGLETIVERKGASAAAVFGIAGVVAVLVATLSIAQGFRHAMVASGDPGTAVVLRSGSDTELMSIFGYESTRIIADAKGIALSDRGPLASPELFVIIDRSKRSTGTDANVPLRGVTPMAFEVHRSVRIIEGRNFVPGRNEVIAGVGAAREFTGLEVGSEIEIGRGHWKVVGIFAADGGVAESEIWTGATTLQDAYQRGNSYQSVQVRLRSPEAFDEFKAGLLADPRLNVKVVRQTDYFIDQSTAVYNLITGLGTLIASLMAVGAVFGALNTMYTAVAARTREIATLRALGFGGGPVVVSVMAESLCLALLGGAIGSAAAYFAFDGFRAATMNWQSFSQVAFAFAVTPGLLLQGVLYATVIGVLGGVFPAIRAARLPVATALREM